jgi:nucleoside-diphosphate-sugar epimerase
LNASHDFIYIDDVCESIILACKNNKKSEILEIGIGKVTSIKKIIKILEKITKKKIIKKNSKSKKENIVLKANMKKSKKSIGWSAKISIENGLKKTLSFF